MPTVTAGVGGPAEYGHSSGLRSTAIRPPLVDADLIAPGPVMISFSPLGPTRLRRWAVHTGPCDHHVLTARVFPEPTAPVIQPPYHCSSPVSTPLA
jgi:hypothetical protein